MDEARIRSAAGFAMRAGCCVSGDFACEKTVKSGRAQFVLLDAGRRTPRWNGTGAWCQRAGIPWAVLTDMGNAIGKYGRKVAAVTDNGFARMLTAAMEADGTNQHGGV